MSCVNSVCVTSSIVDRRDEAGYPDTARTCWGPPRVQPFNGAICVQPHGAPRGHTAVCASSPAGRRAHDLVVPVACKHAPADCPRLAPAPAKVQGGRHGSWRCAAWVRHARDGAARRWRAGAEGMRRAPAPARDRSGPAADRPWTATPSRNASVGRATTRRWRDSRAARARAPPSTSHARCSSLLLKA